MIKYIIKKLISITCMLSLFLIGSFWNRESNAETETAKANDVVAIDKPILGNLAQIGQQTHFYDPPLIYGKLVYGYDSAMYNHGFSWPWGSYLVIRQFNNENNANNTIASYKVNTKKWDFFYNPQISPDGQYITFKTGDLASSFSTYTIYLFSVATQKLETIDAPKFSVWRYPVLWSPNSRYFAYLCGGYDFPTGGNDPMELRVYDLQTRKSRLIIRHEGIYRQITWTSDNKLLYSTAPDFEESRDGKLSSLYRVDLQENKPPTYIIDDAIYPTPSPDRQWIAAFSLWDQRDDAFAIKPILSENALPQHGFPPSKTAPTRQRQRRLMLFPSAGGIPSIVSSTMDYRNNYLLWSPDSLHLYRFTKQHNNTDNAIAHIYDYSLETKTEQEIYTFEYPTYGYDNNTIGPPVLPISITRDGKYLIFIQDERSKANDQGISVNDSYLKALNLQSKLVVNIFSVRNMRGMNWLDESASDMQKFDSSNTNR